MSTLPQEGTPSPAPAAHQMRQVAESFGGDAARYDRTRPAYPAALITRIIAASPGRDVLDVGCGTGIVARQFESAGCAVLGVEPDARMAEFASSTGVRAEVATFEAWDAGDRMFDAVVAGTAWHWVDPVAGAAKAAQVLRPGGLLAPFHHVFQTPPELAGVAAEVYRRLLPDSPFNLRGEHRSGLELYQPLFDKIAGGMRQAGRFTQPEQWQFGWERTYSRDEWLDQIPTQGAFTQLPPEQLAEVQNAVGAAIDSIGGSFTMTYTTVAVTAALQHS